jgi:hypothetical protein
VNRYPKIHVVRSEGGDRDRVPMGFNGSGQPSVASVWPVMVRSPETRRARVLGGLGSLDWARSDEGNLTYLMVGGVLRRAISVVVRDD